MKIIYANAEYTGGGIYRYYAKVSDNKYLLGNTEWDWIYLVDKNPMSDEESLYCEWFDDHTLKIYEGAACKKLTRAIINWIDKHEPSGNYSIYELKEMIETGWI